MDKNTLPINRNLSLSLEKASKTHISLIRSWFNSHEQVREWAGPSFGFPTTSAEFYKQISQSEFTSFALVDGDNLIGFGQYQIHSNFLHLGRLAINPDHRGKGFAYHLLTALIDKGKEQNTIKKVSLYVYQNNLVAYKTYLRAGFSKSKLLNGKRPNEGCDFLTMTLS